MAMEGNTAGVAGKLVKALRSLPARAQLALAAAVVAVPALAYSVIGGDAPRADVPAGGGDGAPRGFYRGSSTVLGVDLDALLEEITQARDGADTVDDEPHDLDDALERMEEGVDAASPPLMPALRDGETAAEILVAHAAALLSGGDAWGAAGNLLVAHERAPDNASALLGLAAIANGQGLPGAALAFADAAQARLGPADRVRGAAAASNRGHALLLLGELDGAEAALREAVKLDPELSEAARNLVHVLTRQDKGDEARRLLPRAAHRLPGRADEPVPVRAPDAEPPSDGGPADMGSPAQIAQWVQAPWLADENGAASPPLWIALDLSRQGQVAWPEIEFPVAGPAYAGYAPAMQERTLAAMMAAQALEAGVINALGPTLQRRQTISDVVQGSLGSMIPTEWIVSPVDTEMFALPAIEGDIVAGRQRTRFQALSVAQAEYHMEREADAQRERAAQFLCKSEDYDACCAEQREFAYSQVGALLPYARDYEEQMRVFFRDAYGLTSAIASNLPEGPYLAAARLDLEAKAMAHYVRTQTEVINAFEVGAPRGGLCLDESSDAGEVPEFDVQVAACGAGSQDYSGKWSIGGTFSVEATCGKVKFVAEIDVIGTRDRWGDKPFEATLGMHAEAEFSIDGTVTIFAGPKGGVAGEIGGVGGDFGIKDGLYLVVGSEGVQDVGMRVVIGGGASAGSGGATHDVETMDFSFVSAI